MGEPRRIDKVDTTTGQVVKEYNCTIKELAKIENIDYVNLTRVLKGERKRIGGFNYRYTSSFSKGKDKYKYEETNDSAYIEGVISIDDINKSNSCTGRERVLEEAIERYKIDLDKWSIKKWTVEEWDSPMKLKNSEITQMKDEKNKERDKVIHLQRGYQITNFLIKIELVPNSEKDLHKSIEKFIEKIPKFKYVDHTPKFTHASGVLLEVAPFDVHFGKATLKSEVHYCDYNLEIAQKNFDYSIDQALGFAINFNPEKIIFIIGQDLMHIDNMKNQTSRAGNPLDVDGRMSNVYEKTFESVLKGIYKCRAVAPVEIKWIPGNHDYLSSLFMCYALHEHFRNDDFVTCDIYEEYGKNERKAVLWGNLLVGWTHQIVRRQEAWVNELAQHFPKLWGESKFREWHFGDQHKKKEQRITPLFTAGGVTLRQLTALSPIDMWHYQNLYTDAVPGGEAFLWSKDVGVFSNFTAWIKMS